MNPADFVLALINTDFPDCADVKSLVASYKKTRTDIEEKCAFLFIDQSNSIANDFPNVYKVKVLHFLPLTLLT